MQLEQDTSADSPDLEEGLDGGGEENTTPEEVSKEIQPDVAQVKEDLDKKKEIEGALTELNDSDKETEKTIHAVDNAFRVSEALEDFYQDLLERPTDISDGEKRLISMAVEAFVEAIGIPPEEVQVALEDMDPVSDDFLGSVILFVWDKVVKVWKIVVEMIKHMVVKLYDLITKVFALSRLIYKRAIKLHARARNVRSVAAFEFVQDPTLIEHLHVKGVPSTDIVSDTTYMFYMAEGIYGEVSRWTTEMGEVISAWLNSVNLTQAEVAPTMPSVKIPYGETKEVTAPKEDVGGKIPYTRLIVSQPLPGGRSVYTRLLDTNTPLPMEQAANVYPWLGSFIIHDEDKFTTNHRLKVLTSSQCKDVTKYVADTTSIISDFEKQSRTNNQIRKSILEGAKRIEQELAELKDTNNRKTIEFAKNVALSIPRIIENPATQFAMYYLHMAGKLLDYVEASLDAHP